jgi:hypothetical protein
MRLRVGRAAATASLRVAQKDHRRLPAANRVGQECMAEAEAEVEAEAEAEAEAEVEVEEEVEVDFTWTRRGQADGKR